MTKTPNEAIDLMSEIENASRLKHTGIINNSNLGGETTIETVENSRQFAENVSKLANLPIKFTTCPKDTKDLVSKQDSYFVSRYVLPIWERY